MVAGTSAEIDLNHFAPGDCGQYVKLGVIEIQDLACRAAHFTGDSYGQSKKACCDAQEKF